MKQQKLGSERLLQPMFISALMAMAPFVGACAPPSGDSEDASTLPTENSAGVPRSDITQGSCSAVTSTCEYVQALCASSPVYDGNKNCLRLDSVCEAPPVSNCLETQPAAACDGACDFLKALEKCSERFERCLKPGATVSCVNQLGSCVARVVKDFAKKAGCPGDGSADGKDECPGKDGFPKDKGEKDKKDSSPKDKGEKDDKDSSPRDKDEKDDKDDKESSPKDESSFPDDESGCPEDGSAGDKDGCPEGDFPEENDFPEEEGESSEEEGDWPEDESDWPENSCPEDEDDWPEEGCPGGHQTQSRSK